MTSLALACDPCCVVRAGSEFSCLPCPFGGVCADGRIVSAAGYWASAVDVREPLTFTACPRGYCCSGGAATTPWPCDSSSACAGHRTGVLCGRCEAGFVEALGSTDCVPLARCDSDVPVAWALVAVAELVAAVLQLAVVSDVWMPAALPPSGKLKLAVYFFQVWRWSRQVVFAAHTTGAGFVPCFVR